MDQKSNEITAVPKLLRLLNLKGAIVSVDAMGTQLKIAIAIIQAGADYLLALKGKVREEVRYYISSLAPDAGQHLELSRAHWRIENSCHWVLDVVFREDDARARCGDAAQNLSTLRRIALNLLKTETAKPKEPIRGKRIYAALDPSYLEAILGIRQM